MDRLKARVISFLAGESGQDTIEYLLVVGAFAVALVVALVLGFEVLVPQVVGLICPSVDTANPASAVGNCITSLT